MAHLNPNINPVIYIQVDCDREKIKNILSIAQKYCFYPAGCDTIEEFIKDCAARANYLEFDFDLICINFNYYHPGEEKKIITSEEELIEWLEQTE